MNVSFISGNDFWQFRRSVCVHQLRAPGHVGCRCGTGSLLLWRPAVPGSGRGAQGRCSLLMLVEHVPDLESGGRGLVTGNEIGQIRPSCHQGAATWQCGLLHRPARAVVAGPCTVSPPRLASSPAVPESPARAWTSSVLTSQDPALRSIRRCSTKIDIFFPDVRLCNSASTPQGCEIVTPGSPRTRAVTGAQGP